MEDWVNVVSSDISSVKYEENTGVMIIRFNKGGEYEYYDVYVEDYYNLITAPSVGRYFNTNIRNKYQYTKTY